MIRNLGSRTSGVDGSSEGGRVDTTRLAHALVIYGVALMNQLKAGGYKGKLSAEPHQVDGIWCIKLSYEGDPPADVPALWHGHRVIVERAADG